MNIIDCSGNVIKSYLWTNAPTSALSHPLLLFQLDIPLSGFKDGIYFLTSQTGTGAPIISEGLDIRSRHENSVLVQYKNDTNKLGAIFTEGYNPTLRIPGYIIQYEPKGTFTAYVNQPADIDLLNGIPFDTYTLFIEAPRGIPDWLLRKINRITMLNNVTYDGHEYTRDEGSNFDKIEVAPNWALFNWSLKIRDAINRDGVTFDGETGSVIPDSAMIAAYNINLDAFGQTPDGNMNILQVKSDLN
jgi:hypothetical protein